jgi:uncharacterized protein involved in outer membrane biogenesis
VDVITPISTPATAPARKRRWGRNATLIVAGLLLLAIGAIFGIHTLLDTDHVKAMARDRARAMWSRDLEIRDLAFRLLPTPSLRARGVTLSNPPGASEPTLLQADAVTMQVDLLPLLNGQVALSRLAVDGMHLNLEVLADGSKTWDLKRGERAPMARQNTFDPAALRAVRLHNVDIRYRAAGKSPLVLHIDDLAATAEIGGHNAVVDASASRDTHPLHTHLELADISNFGEKDATSEGALRVEWGEAALTMAGRLPLTATLQRAKVKMRFEAKSMAELFGFFDIRHGAVAPLSIAADLAEKDGTLDIDQLAFQLGAMHINGNARGAIAHSPRSFSARLAVDRLDWARATQDAGLPPPPRMPDDEAFPIAPLAWPALLAMDGSEGTVDMRIGWTRLRSGVELTNTDAHLHFTGNKLDIPHYAFDLLGGMASGKLLLDAHAKSARLYFSGHGMLLEKWFAQRGRKVPLSGGPTDLNAAVTTSGATLKEMAASLSGPVSIKVGPARILSAGAQEAETLLVGFAPLFSPANSDRVELACASTVLAFSNGVAKGQAIAGARSEASQWLGSGVLDLKRQVVDWRGRIAPRSGVSLGVTNLTGDVRVNGRVNHPSVSLDPAGAPSALARLGAAIVTGGASLIATAVWDASNEHTDPCRVVFARNRIVADRAAAAPATPAAAAGLPRAPARAQVRSGSLARSLRGRRPRSEMCESRGQSGSSDKPRVVPWAQSVISKWTGFSRIAAAVLLPRRLLGAVTPGLPLAPRSFAAAHSHDKRPGNPDYSWRPGSRSFLSARRASGS